MEKRSFKLLFFLLIKRVIFANWNNTTHMNILILGSGGREHAFALKLAESNKVDKLFVAPGNAGTSQVAINLAINLMDF